MRGTLLEWGFVAPAWRGVSIRGYGAAIAKFETWGVDSDAAAGGMLWPSPSLALNVSTRSASKTKWRANGDGAPSVRRLSRSRLLAKRRQPPHLLLAIRNPAGRPIPASRSPRLPRFARIAPVRSPPLRRGNLRRGNLRQRSALSNRPPRAGRFSLAPPLRRRSIAGSKSCPAFGAKYRGCGRRSSTGWGSW